MKIRGIMGHFLGGDKIREFTDKLYHLTSEGLGRDYVSKFCKGFREFQIEC